jgi:hypothetical protein
MHVLLFIAVLITATALAQNPTPPHSQGITPALLVLPVSGPPLSAETVEERTTKLPDGTSKTTVTTSKVFRDADGRMRIEMNIDGPESVPIVQIMDRLDGFMAILIPQQRMAARFQFPKQDPSAQVGLAFVGGPLIMVPGSLRILESRPSRASNSKVTAPRPLRMSSHLSRGSKKFGRIENSG